MFGFASANAQFHSLAMAFDQKIVALGARSNSSNSFAVIDRYHVAEVKTPNWFGVRLGPNRSIPSQNRPLAKPNYPPSDQSTNYCYLMPFAPRFQAHGDSHQTLQYRLPASNLTDLPHQGRVNANIGVPRAINHPGPSRLTTDRALPSNDA